MVKKPYTFLSILYYTVNSCIFQIILNYGDEDNRHFDPTNKLANIPVAALVALILCCERLGGLLKFYIFRRSL